MADMDTAGGADLDESPPDMGQVVGTGTQDGTWIVKRGDGSTFQTSLPPEQLEKMGVDTSPLKNPGADDSAKRAAAWQGSLGQSVVDALNGSGGNSGSLVNLGIGADNQPIPEGSAVLPEQPPLDAAPVAASPQPQSAGGEPPNPAHTATPEQQNSVANAYTNLLQGGGGGDGGELTSALKQQEKAAQDVASEKAGLATKLAGLYDQKANLEQGEATRQANYANDIKKQYADHEKFMDSQIQQVMNAKIDPDHFWATKTTGQKIGLGIASIIGGIASGAIGRPNPVLQYIDGEVNRDLEAQRDNLTNKRTGLEMQNKVFGQHIQGLQDAELAMHASKATIYSSLADQAAQQTQLAQSPIEQANGQQLVGKLRERAVQERQAATLRNQQIATGRLQQIAMGMNLQGQIAERKMLGGQQLSPEEQQAAIRQAASEGRVLSADESGVRVATLRKPEPAEASQYRSLQTAQNLVAQIDRLSNSASPADRYKASALATMLKSKILPALGESGVRFNPEFLKAMDSIVPENPDAITTFWKPRRDAILGGLNAEQQSLAKSLGIRTIGGQGGGSYRPVTEAEKNKLLQAGG